MAYDSKLACLTPEVALARSASSPPELLLRSTLAVAPVELWMPFEIVLPRQEDENVAPGEEGESRCSWWLPPGYLQLGPSD